MKNQSVTKLRNLKLLFLVSSILCTNAMAMDYGCIASEEVSNTNGRVVTNVGYRIETIEKKGLLSANTGDVNGYGHNRTSLITGQDYDKHISKPISYWTLKGEPKSGYRIETIEKKGLLSANTGDVNGYGHNRTSLITGQDYDKHISKPISYWNFIPVNYKLKQKIIDFDFGGDSALIKLLRHKNIECVMTSKIIAKVLGGEIEGECGEEIAESKALNFSNSNSNSFSHSNMTSNTHSVGVSVETEVSVGIPLLAEGKVKVGVEYGYSHTSENTTTHGSENVFTKGGEIIHTTTKNYRSLYRFKPEKVGVYMVKKIVNVAKDVEMPFTAKIIYSARNSKGEIYNSTAIRSFLEFSKLMPVKIIKETEDSIEGIIQGTMRGTYCMESETVFDYLDSK